MGQRKPQRVEDLWPSSYGDAHLHIGQMKKKDLPPCVIIGHEGDADDKDHHEVPSVSSSSLASSSSIGHDDGDSSISNGSTSSSNDHIDDDDDTSSTITCSKSLNSSSGALYDLSEIMAQLPIKRGLSQYYYGKSDSFTYLSSVTSLEDLAKKESPYCTRKKNKKKKKAVAYRLFTLPRPLISKKNSRGTSLSTSSSLRRSFINAANGSRPPQIPLHKGFNGG